MSETNATAAAYIRVSTDDQTEYSPDSQLAEIRKYAQAHGFALPTRYIFSDEGISGKSIDKRPAFHRMIGTAKQRPKPFDVLLLWKFSRFARNRQDSIVYKSMLRRDLGIDVISVSEPIGDDKISVLIEAMIEAMDEYYSINLAEEVRRGMTQRIKNGRPNTHAPFGYRMQAGEYVPDPETSPVVQQIYTAFAAGCGLRTIARQLNESGVRTIYGNRFQNRSIAYILQNPAYIGQVHWTPNGRAGQTDTGTLRTAGAHPPLVSQTLYATVQQRLAAQRRRPTPHARADGVPYLLKGLVRCSCCGAVLTRVSGAGHPALQCHRYAKGTCGESHYVSLEHLTAAVLVQLRRDFPFLRVAVSLQRTPAATPDPSRRLAQENRRLQRIRQAYEAGIDTLEEYRRRKKQILRQMESLQPSTSPAQPEPSPPDPVIEREQNEVLRSLIHKIVWNRKENRFCIYYDLR